MDNRTTTQLSSKTVPCAAYAGVIVELDGVFEELLLLRRDHKLLDSSLACRRFQRSLDSMYWRITRVSRTMLTVQLATAILC